jgi:hypothetical protein
VSEEKIKQIMKWFNKSDLSNFDPIPVKLLDGIPVMTDGHTRAVVAINSGLDTVPMVGDQDDLDWEMYRKCVSECKRRGIISALDLTSVIVSGKEYEEKWYRWCDDMHAEMISQR